MPDGCIAVLVAYILVAVIGQIVFLLNYFGGGGLGSPSDRQCAHYNFSKWFWSVMWCAVWPVAGIFGFWFHVYDYSQDR